MKTNLVLICMNFILNYYNYTKRLKIHRIIKKRLGAQTKKCLMQPRVPPIAHRPYRNPPTITLALPKHYSDKLQLSLKG